MPHTLRFQTKYTYRDTELGITLPITLSLDNRTRVGLFAKLDTGAPFCVFQRQYGHRLGLRIEHGDPRTIVSITGDRFRVYGHELKLTALGYEIFQTVYFAADRSIPRNVLGRSGWLDQFRLAISDYDRELYLGPYDD